MRFDWKRNKRTGRWVKVKDRGGPGRKTLSKTPQPRPYRKDPRTKEQRKEEQFRRALKEYNITAEEFARLVVEQDNKCAICGTDNCGPGRTRLCIDHCHKSGKVRGLLCSNCNRGLGLFGDCPEKVAKAATYLNKLRE